MHFRLKTTSKDWIKLFPIFHIYQWEVTIEIWKSTGRKRPRLNQTSSGTTRRAGKAATVSTKTKSAQAWSNRKEAPTESAADTERRPSNRREARTKISGRLRATRTILRIKDSKWKIKMKMSSIIADMRTSSRPSSELALNTSKKEWSCAKVQLVDTWDHRLTNRKSLE